MANNAITLKAQDRTEFGKGSARQARRAGQVPVVVYGHGTEPRHLLLEEHATRLALRSNDNALVELVIDGGETLLVLGKDVQRHPIRPGVQHVDFLLVNRNERVDVEVPVTVIGTAAPGTMHMIEAVTVMVSAPAVSVPEAIEVDINRCGCRHRPHHRRHHPARGRRGRLRRRDRRGQRGQRARRRLRGS